MNFQILFEKHHGYKDNTLEKKLTCSTVITHVSRGTVTAVLIRTSVNTSTSILAQSWAATFI